MDRIGSYNIEKKLGTGGMGTVYLAKHQDSGELFAIKVLPANLARESGFLARFDREIAALQQLSNPNVVRIIESGSTSETGEAEAEDTSYYFVMEYVDGETLLTRLRREKRLDWQTTIDYGVQICAALKAAHDAGIIHRDLKPSNLLISNEGVVKLADFGVAQIFASTRLTKTGGIIGTAEFMSPEQAQGHRATKKSDLYALGAVLYTMLTGRPPYSGQTMLDVLHKHQFGQYDRPRNYAPDCPTWLEQVIMQLLDKEPDKRPANAYVTSLRLKEIPKKVELSQSDPLPAHQSTALHSSKTEAAVDDEGHDDLYDSQYMLPDDAPTRTAPGFTGGDESVAPRGPGEATLMHTLMRETLAEEAELHPIQKFFDNIWVLVGLLALIVLGGFVWYRSLPTPEWHYDQALKLIEAGEFSEARIDHLQPLLREGDDWQKKAQSLIDQTREIERLSGISQSSKRALAKSTINGEDVDEANRLLHRALDASEQGDITRAREQLEALIVLTEGNDEADAVRTIAVAQLKSLPDTDVANSARDAFIQDALSRIKTLRDAGKTMEADRIESALRQLYRDDPVAQAQLK